MNQAVSAAQIQAAMSCQSVINSLSETLFTVTEKCIRDEMATCLTFMRNDLSCFIIELSPRMNKSKSSRTFLKQSLLFLTARIALISATGRKKQMNNSMRLSFLPPSFWELTELFPSQSQWLHFDWTATTAFFSDSDKVLYLCSKWFVHMR